MKQWRITWDSFADAYLYGTHFEMLPGREVLWSNRLAPPGGILTAWYSKVNFQAKRIEPALPLLCEGREYSLQLNAQTEGRGGCLLRVSFFDRFDKQKGEVLMREGRGSFVYPEGTYSYQIELIQAGINALRFSSILLEEVGA